MRTVSTGAASMRCPALRPDRPALRLATSFGKTAPRAGPSPRAAPVDHPIDPFQENAMNKFNSYQGKNPGPTRYGNHRPDATPGQAHVEAPSASDAAQAAVAISSIDARTDASPDANVLVAPGAARAVPIKHC
jgi:hypothetical protein